MLVGLSLNFTPFSAFRTSAQTAAEEKGLFRETRVAFSSLVSACVMFIFPLSLFLRDPGSLFFSLDSSDRVGYAKLDVYVILN